MLDRIKLGKRFKLFREILNHGQDRISDASGLSQTQISNFESGKAQSIETFLGLLKYYRPYFNFDNLLDDKGRFIPIKKMDGPEVNEVRKDLIKVQAKAIKEDMSSKFNDLLELIDEIYPENQ
ncbi:MAG: helix-turn-helix transcriptional regulator [Bacteroidota bacterium]